ncbi:MAG: LTA synthase family protein [Ignavibacteria bacterium]|nr:LTA synthase family protein [Ignavibacteria bacterium]
MEYTRLKEIYKILSMRLGISLMLMSIARAVFYIHNYHYFNALPCSQVALLFVKGLYFDISAGVLLNSAYIILLTFPHPSHSNRIFRNVADVFYLLPNIAGFIINVGDAAYFPFTLKRLTFDIFDYLQSDATSVSMLPKFLISFWPLTLIGAVLIVAVVILTRRIQPREKHRGYNWKIALQQSGAFLVSIIVAIILFRGGLQLKPISIITAGEFTSAETVPFILNTPFTLIKTFNRKGLEKKADFSQAQADSIYNPVHNYSDTPLSVPFTASRPNVVIIILESFSKEHLGKGNGLFENGRYKGFTPFLDSLIGEGYYFPEAFANGKRSIEGIPAIVAGLPTLMEEAYITSNYAGNRINSLASLLKMNGYTSAFYHGGANGTMGFQSFCKIAGFDSYYGKDEYPEKNDYDGNWGIWDEPYFQYFAKNLNGTSQPFLATIFSLSSHHPYKVPTAYTGKFRKGKLEIQQSIMYADYSLRRFFETASRMPWYNNTLFVITADHTSEAVIPYYQTRVGNFRVPILFFMPGDKQFKGESKSIIQQTDIMPGILHLLHYKSPFLAFGSSPFDTSAVRAAFTYLNGTYQVIYGQSAAQYTGVNFTGFYNYEADSLLQHPLTNYGNEQKRSESLLRAYIQQYNNRMIGNSLIIR